MSYWFLKWIEIFKWIQRARGKRGSYSLVHNYHRAAYNKPRTQTGSAQNSATYDSF